MLNPLTGFKLKHQLDHRTTLARSMDARSTRMAGGQQRAQEIELSAMSNNGNDDADTNVSTSSSTCSNVRRVPGVLRHAMNHRASESRRLYYKPLPLKLVATVSLLSLVLCFALLIRLATWGGDKTCGGDNKFNGTDHEDLYRNCTSSSTSSFCRERRVVSFCKEHAFPVFSFPKHESCACTNFVYVDGDCSSPTSVAARKELLLVAENSHNIILASIIFRCTETVIGVNKLLDTATLLSVLYLEREQQLNGHWPVWPAVQGVSRLTSLNVIRLRNIQISSDWLLPKAPSLKALMLLGVGARGVTRAISQARELNMLSNIRELKLSNNNLTRVPAELSLLIETGHSALNFLDMLNNRIAALPDSIGRLSTLQGLYVENNHLTELPASIGQLSELTALFVNSNRLTSLPGSIGQLSRMATLDLHSNRITALPDSIGQLSKRLASLLLQSNQLTALPDSIGQIAGLGVLNLASNRLSSVPDSIAKLGRLRFLDISTNSITSVAFLTAMRGSEKDRRLYHGTLLKPAGGNDTLVLLGGNPVCGNNSLLPPLILGKRWYAKCWSPCAPTCNSIAWKPAQMMLDRRSNGKCDVGCNNTECGFDRGECANPNCATALDAAGLCTRSYT